MQLLYFPSLFNSVLDESLSLSGLCWESLHAGKGALLGSTGAGVSWSVPPWDRRTGWHFSRMTLSEKTMCLSPGECPLKLSCKQVPLTASSPEEQNPWQIKHCNSYWWWQGYLLHRSADYCVHPAGFGKGYSGQTMAWGYGDNKCKVIRRATRWVCCPKKNSKELKIGKGGENEPFSHN